MKTRFIKIIVGFFLITFIFSPFVWAAKTAGITVVVTLEQVEIIVATVEFQPKIIGLRQRYLRCYIELPAPYKVEDIDVNSIALTELNGAPIEPPLKTIGLSRIGDFDRDRIADLQVRFDIQKIIPLLKVGENRLTVAGNLKEDKRFQGTGTLRLRK